MKMNFKFGQLKLVLGLMVSLPFAMQAQSVDTVCYGDSPIQFMSLNSATGSTGSNDYIYQWQDSTAGGAWAAAPGPNGDTAYQAVGLIEDTWFRRQVRVLVCQEEAYSNIIQVMVLDSISATLSNVTNATCANIPDGSAMVSATGGLPPYSYAWSNGDMTTTADSLAPGNYDVTVTDSKGCESIAALSIGFDNAAPNIQFSRDTFFLTPGFEDTLASPGSYESYFWSTGSTDSTTEVTATGYVYLTVTNAAGCANFDSVWVELLVGIAEADLRKPDARLFPNPARQEINIFIGDAQVPDLVEIRSLEGRVMRIDRNTSQINVSTMAAGIYLVHIERDGNIWSKRLVIQ